MHMPKCMTAASRQPCFDSFTPHLEHGFVLMQFVYVMFVVLSGAVQGLLVQRGLFFQHRQAIPEVCDS